jgi:hypothetical protein
MNCERCGAKLALVGKMHRYVPLGTPSRRAGERECATLQSP